MAKVLGTPKRVHLRPDPNVARIRARFAEALSMGHTHEEAAKLAHGDGPIGSAPAPVSQQAAKPPGETERGETIETVTIDGSPHQEDILDYVPPNWEDLSWPDLKSLAERLSPRTEISSKKVALRAIEKAIAAANKVVPSTEGT